MNNICKIIYKLISKIFLNYISVLNLIILCVFFYFIKLNNKKIVVFYHGSTGSYLNHDYIIKRVINNYRLTNEKIFFIVLYELFLFKKFFFFINIRFVQFLNFVDIILVNNTKRLLPKKSIKVLLPHDIYDTLSSNSKLIDPEDRFLLQFNFILCPNKIVINFFAKKIKLYNNINKHKKYENNKKKIQLIELGYFKLDILLEHIIKTNVLKRDSILILLSNTGSLLNLQIITLISLLLKKFSNFNIILRPHPGHYRSYKKFYSSIENNFIGNKRFKIDVDPIYLESFVRSKLAIAEMSGSAYSFAFSTLNPVAHYFKKMTAQQKNSYYFKDSIEIGLNSKKFPQLLKSVQQLLNRSKYYKKKIKKLRKKRISKINMSFLNFKLFLTYVFENKKSSLFKKEIYLDS